MPNNFPVRVLIVDDQPIVLTGLCTILESHGFACRTVGSGLEALTSLRETLPDVIISDLNMPEMSGYELFSVVHRRFSEIALIALSGHFIVEIETSQVPMNAFFRKGEYTPEELVATISQLHRESWRLRQRLPEQTPLRVRRGELVEFLLTCGECLRPFPLEDAAFADCSSAEAECPFCDAHIPYVMDGAALLGNLALAACY